MLTNREKNTLQRVIFVLRQLADNADSSKTADIIMDDIATLRTNQAESPRSLVVG